MALAGSRWLVMKNSVQSLTRETRRRRRRRTVVVGRRRKSEGKGRGEMRGRWKTSEERSREERRIKVEALR